MLPSSHLGVEASVVSVLGGVLELVEGAIFSVEQLAVAEEEVIVDRLQHLRAHLRLVGWRRLLGFRAADAERVQYGESRAQAPIGGSVDPGTEGSRSWPDVGAGARAHERGAEINLTITIIFSKKIVEIEKPLKVTGTETRET
jgi:hypothetical protein